MNRKIRKVMQRLKYIPKGLNFFKYSANKAEHFYMKYSHSLKVAPPSSIMIELTNHCNLHCIICPREHAYGKDMDTGQMDFPLFTSIVDQAYPYVDSICLTGLGEPLLYKNLPDALHYIRSKNKGIITFISTNATLPNTASLVQKIIPDVDTIQVSFDGIGSVYNSIRKNGNYEIFFCNLKEIIAIASKTHTDIILNCVLVKENYFQMCEMIEMAESLGVNTLNFNIFNLASETDLDIDYYNFYHSQPFLEELKKAKEKAALSETTNVTFWDYNTENGFRKCEFPWSHYSITWDGYLIPCCAKPFPKELNFGNIRENKMIDLLNTKQYQNFRKLWFQNQTHPFCKKCNYIDFKPVKEL